jgi:hypothetical protein
MSVRVGVDSSGGLDVYVETDLAGYDVSTGEIVVSAHPARGSREMLPDLFVGVAIEEAIANREDVVLALSGGRFMVVGWSIDTATGRGIQSVTFHGPSDATREFLDWFDDMRDTARGATQVD